MRGISLLVVGNPAYMMFAANLMVSLKYHNKDIPIQILTQKHLIDTIPQHLRLWDHIEYINNEDTYLNGKLMPGLAKLSMYKYLWNCGWKETIYLDVDAIAIKDITGLFNHDKAVNIAIQEDVYNWLDPDVISKHFGFEGTAKGINDSYIYIRKSKQAEKVFKDARALMLKQPVMLEKLKNSWFKNQPDELYMSASLLKNSIEPYPMFSKKPIYFRYRHEYTGIQNGDIEKQYWLIGTYGDQQFCHVSIGKMYDKLLQVYFRDMFRGNHLYKYHFLMDKKHKY
jgi:hypothetical protein